MPGKEKRIKAMNEGMAENIQFIPEAIPPFPTKMLIELTNACNSRCIFCANRMMTRNIGSMREDFFGRIMREAYSLGVREAGLHATGEPFLSKSLPAFVREAKEIGFDYVFLTSNGALATPSRVVPVIEAGLDSIKFSINAGTSDTYKRVHGTDDFESVLQNLAFISNYKKLYGKPSRIYISFVVTKYSQGEIELFRELVRPLVDDVFFYDVGSSGGMMNNITRELRVEGDERKMDAKPPCSMVFNKVHVTWEGYMTACCVDYQNYLVVSDLNTVSMKSAWCSERFIDIRKRHLENNLEGTLCYNCLYEKSEKAYPLSPEHATLFEESKCANDVPDRTVLGGGA